MQVFPRLDVYPNVALSCVVNFDGVKEDLSENERSFFFRAIIDSVVFDEDYMPRYFFELDSIYHDDRDRQLKDSMKDNILSVAGQKLYRIRKIKKDASLDDFVHMIKDVLD